MLRNNKKQICSNCNSPVSSNDNECPSCGQRIRQPFYKQSWFIAIIVILFLASIGYYRQYVARQFNWDDIELANLLPQPVSTIGETNLNTDRYLSIDVDKTSKEEYREYVNKCQSMGFTIEKEKLEYNYKAYNAEGYKLYVWYDAKDKQMSINLEAPMKMETIQWPNSAIANVLPIPKSNIGKIITETPEKFYIYIGDTSISDFNAYVDECYNKGFSVYYEKSDGYFYGKNSEGYSLYVTYQGNKVISINLTKQKPTE